MLNTITENIRECFVWLAYFVRFGEIPIIAFSVFPLFASVSSFVSGALLLHKLKPGMVCRASLGCDRCEFLYSLGLGSVGFSFIYFIMELRWIIQKSYLRVSSLDELLWSTLEGALFAFLSLLCYRGISCLRAHTAFDPFPICRGRNHRN